MREVDLEKTVTFSEAMDFLRAMSHPPPHISMLSIVQDYKKSGYGWR